ncbi:hypothetical protein ACGF07_33535 [Kitasatospora sp. NPDC048194]|uniref:hypothetical protein n=1 Tax=Kitasatospora sp. NPDC048194 TaxID=3364045 RepID=UPI003723A537
MYKDYGWQTTGPKARSAHYVVNARNDDCALMHFSTGEYITLYPQNSWALTAPIIEIDIENGCP